MCSRTVFETRHKSSLSCCSRRHSFERSGHTDLEYLDSLLDFFITFFLLTDLHFCFTRGIRVGFSFSLYITHHVSGEPTVRKDLLWVWAWLYLHSLKTPFSKTSLRNCETPVADELMMIWVPAAGLSVALEPLYNPSVMDRLSSVWAPPHSRSLVLPQAAEMSSAARRCGFVSQGCKAVWAAGKPDPPQPKTEKNSLTLWTCTRPCKVIYIPWFCLLISRFLSRIRGINLSTTNKCHWV